MIKDMGAKNRIEVRNIGGTLSYAFAFDETKEGMTYWMAVAVGIYDIAWNNKEAWINHEKASEEKL